MAATRNLLVSSHHCRPVEQKGEGAEPLLTSHSCGPRRGGARGSTATEATQNLFINLRSLCRLGGIHRTSDEEEEVTQEQLSLHDGTGNRNRSEGKMLLLSLTSQISLTTVWCAIDPILI